MNIMIGILYYCALFSIEQIVIGTLVRIIRLLANKTKNNINKK